MKQQGMALVIVIWIVALLTIMAGSFALSMKREISVISAIRDNAELLALAEAGLNVAGVMLFHQDKTNQWQGDGSIYSFQYQGAEIRLRIFSESGKIDINKADQNLLLAIMKIASDDDIKQQELVDALLDWRDEDDLVHLYGAESKQYTDSGLSYQPANKDFQTVEELQLLLGMEEEIYKQLEPLITVYSRQKKVNLQLASKEVLMAISSIDPELLDSYVEQRLESNRLQEAPPAFPLEGVRQSKTNSEVFTVFAEAQNTEEAKAGIRATIKKSDVGIRKSIKNQYPFQILDWKRIFDENDSLFSDGMEQFLIHSDAEPKELSGNKLDILALRYRSDLVDLIEQNRRHSRLC